MDCLGPVIVILGDSLGRRKRSPAKPHGGWRTRWEGEEGAIWLFPSFSGSMPELH